MTTPAHQPGHTPGQLDLAAGERELYAARLEQIEAERNRLASQMAEHTVRAVSGVADAWTRHQGTGAALNDAVRAARAAGATWEDIGRAVGISRQAAHTRWAAL